MAEDKIESKEQQAIRSDSEKKIQAIMGGLPLLGQGCKFVKEDSMSMLVMLAKGQGATDVRIAERMGISLNTLKRHFAVELERGGEYLDTFIYDGMIAGVMRSIGGNASYNNILLRMAAHRLGMSDKIQQDNISSDGSMGTGQILNGLPVGSRLVVETPPAETASAEQSSPTPPQAKPTRKPKAGKTAKTRAKPPVDLGF